MQKWTVHERPAGSESSLRWLWWTTWSNVVKTNSSTVLNKISRVDLLWLTSLWPSTRSFWASQVHGMCSCLSLAFCFQCFPLLRLWLRKSLPAFCIFDCGQWQCTNSDQSRKCPHFDSKWKLIKNLQIASIDFYRRVDVSNLIRLWLSGVEKDLQASFSLWRSRPAGKAEAVRIEQARSELVLSNQRKARTR